MQLPIAVVLSGAVLAASGPVAEVPFTQPRGNLLVPLTVNGHEGVRAMFDTGMPEGLFFYDPALGDSLGFAYVGNAQVMGGGSGSKVGKVAMGATFSLGGASFTGERAIVLAERHEFADLAADAIVGQSVFDRYVVGIDFVARKIRLYDRETFDPSRAGEALPLSFLHGKPVVEGALELEEGKSLPVKLTLDTGFVGSLSIDIDTLAGAKVPAKGVEAVIGSGIAGSFRGRRARVAAFRIGSSRLPAVIADFPSNDSGVLGKRDADNGIFGLGILRRFEVTIDYAGKRLWLKPNAAFGEPFETNMAGLMLRGAAGGKLRVLDLVEGSSGAAAGLKVDDLLVAIDGRPVAEMDHAALEKAFQRDGATVKLSYERGGEAKEVSFRLARIL